VYINAQVPHALSTLTLLSAQIHVRDRSRELTIEVASDKPYYRPGEEAVVQVNARDAGGKPAAAHLWLTAYDTRVLAIQPELAQPIFEHFYGRMRQYMDWVDHSGNYNPGVQLNRESQRHLNVQGMPPAASWVWWHYWAGYQGNNDFWQRATTDPNLQGEAPKDDQAKELEGLGESRRRDRGAADDADGYNESVQKSAEGAPAPAAPGARAARQEGPAGAKKEPEFKAAEVRKDFRDTAAWFAQVALDADGHGQVRFAFPDNLTRWRVLARAAAGQQSFGEAQRDVVTRKQVMVQMATPRFLTEQDEVILSAVVHNQLLEATEAKVVLALSGGQLELAQGGTSAERIVTLKPGKDYRLDWRVKVMRDGEATIEMQALTTHESDAIRRPLRVVRYGVDKQASAAGAMIGRGGVAGDQDVALRLVIPSERDVAASRLRIVLAPSVAIAALEALPYLADYPYGCVEQTMSRFGPAVQVKRALTDLGLPLEAITGGQAGKSLPAGTWGRPHFAKFKALRNDELDAMVEAGLARLYAFQHSDGGWGWWKHDSTNDYMTAYVVDGLTTARDCDLAIRPGVIERGAGLLAAKLLQVDLLRLEPVRYDQENRPSHSRYSHYERNELTFALYVSCRLLSLRSEKQQGEIRALVAQLCQYRDELGAYARALLAQCAWYNGQRETAQLLVKELLSQAQVERNGDVHWSADAGWWRWWQDPVETSAAMLRTLLEVEPTHDSIPGIVAYLTHARRGVHWHSTRTTAVAIGALVRYLKVSGELDPNYTVDVWVNGVRKGQVCFTRETILTAENIIELDGEDVPSGEVEVRLIKHGPGNLYYGAFARFFTREARIEPAGYRIAVRRQYTRIIKQADGSEQRQALLDGAKLVSGDLVEVTLELDADRDYQYLCLEERKAAGLEPLEQRSGQGAGIATHMELRDDRVVIFASVVPQGTSRVSYRLRAEAPGHFCALPLTGYLMYAPDIYANSDNFRIIIGDE
jgi:uncharacterized protein YfaS (alpha-2-macroglobulin family)